MGLRVLSSLCCCVVVLVAAGQAQNAPLGAPPIGMRNAPPGFSMDHGSTLITGTCYGVDGVPMSGVTIELRDPASNSILAFTTTHSNGSFELYNMPTGSFELVARSQGDEAREMIPAGRSMARVDLRMAHNVHAPDAAGSSVSVARLRIPAKARDRYNKAAEAFSKGKFDQADKAVNQSLAIYPENPEALTLLGLLAWRNKNASAAIDDLQKSISVDPNYQPAYIAMSSVFNSESKFDDAVRTTQRAVVLDPQAWQGYFEMAKAMLGKGLYSAAFETAKKAEALAPAGIAGIHLLKAYALLPQKLYNDAGAELQAFLSHAPKGLDTSDVKTLLAKVQAAQTAAAIDPGAAPVFAVVNH